jgi:hypothetical protein
VIAVIVRQLLVGRIRFERPEAAYYTSCFLVPPPLPVPLFAIALPRWPRAVADALVVMVAIDLLLLLLHAFVRTRGRVAHFGDLEIDFFHICVAPGPTAYSFHHRRLAEAPVALH